MKKIILVLSSLMLLVSFTHKKETQPITTKFSLDDKSAIVYSTAFNLDLKITPTDTLKFNDAVQPLETETAVFVNTDKRFQTLIGIGGALTDASAEVFAKLSKEKQQELLDAYYSDEKGIGYTFGRISIHSCDFSSSSFTYVDEGDKDLKTFSIDHDKQFRIPLIKRAIETAGGKLTLFASPWSPPAFMKSNNDMLHGGKLLPEFYQSWADYYVRFINAYQDEGIPIWGITVQNEPMAIQRWESCIYTAEEERDFLKNYLGPTMEKAGLRDKKIIVWDHNRDLMNYRANVIFSDPDAAKYAWGIGFHWYETWQGSVPMYRNELAVKQAFPDKNLIFTEGCAENFNDSSYNSIKNAERYGSQMINDFNCGTTAWTDWNILLDQHGGPNHVENFCMAPVHANLESGDLIYTPSYYYIGQFSKFIRPGATRVSTAASRSQLLSTSFLNEDGKMVTVVMNQSENKIKYKLIVDDKETII